jgi:hypothetical protein
MLEYTAIASPKSSTFTVPSSWSPIRVNREFIGQDLDSDFTFQLRIACAIQFAHTAFTY